jgi:hypothetical protein
MSNTTPKRTERRTKFLEEIFVRTLIARLKNAKENNPDLGIDDEMLSEIENSSRQALEIGTESLSHYHSPS